MEDTMTANSSSSVHSIAAGRRHRQPGALRLIALLIIIGVMLAGFPRQIAEAAAYSYTNAVSYNLPDGTSSSDSGCPYWPATRYFLVDDYFTINDLNVEFSQSHSNRGQIQMQLTAPDGTTKVLVATSSDTYNNYYITLDGDSGGALNDGSDDTIGGTRRTVQQTLLNDFDGKNAHGHWTMTICDNTFNSTGTSQLFNEARLVFDGTAFTPTPPQHKQGPATAETYFVPWPEDQVWTSVGRIFPTSCSNYATFRDSYDAAPRQPMVSFTAITVYDASTVITYDQWEDGYEAAITFPTQTTTQVWGDGDLLNGVAPGDADDILVAGQVITLNDVMLSTTLGTVIDYDGRDKIAASRRIAVTRSVWSDGSQTMFAAADEVYPTDRWGTQFYSPVGDNANLNGMFDFAGASIIAATDGTLVDIDKNADGTYETTGIALSQGGTYFIDDNTTGLYRGGGIRSNSGHPIQVNLMTGNVCAGFESRTYPLMPFDQWSNSYYSPVGTITTNPGAPPNDDAPTTISLYNPNASAIIVAYDFATGSTASVNIAAKSGANVTMNDLTGAHFYAVTSLGGTTTNNVADSFGSQVYTRQDGSVNWATNWTETGDDGSATTGSISIGGSGSRYLRFYTNAAANVGDTIERQSYDLTGYTSATLGFTYGNSSGESGDVLGVQMSKDGGANWTEIATIAGNTSGTFSQGVSSYIASNTRIRFKINARSGDTSSEYIYVDNVDITFSYTTPPTPSTAVFYAVGSVDSDAGGTSPDTNDAYDWGITLVSEKVMSQFLIVGWAPGDDPTFLGSGVENTAPIWLTGGHPMGATDQTSTYDICVDYNGDGGATQDPLSGKYYDRKVTGLAPRAQYKIYKNKVVPPDTGHGTAGDNQTGTQIWVCGPTIEAPGTLLNTDVLITAAWGEDPLVASRSKPGLDMGYTVRNRGGTPTGLVVTSFTATAATKSVILKWEMASEVGILGFNLYRATTVDGPRTLVNEDLILSQAPPGSSLGAAYRYEDLPMQQSKTYFYWLEVLDIHGNTRLYGPYTGQLSK
jgi:subtilisin-like proprotein convertase family protein